MPRLDKAKQGKARQIKKNENKSIRNTTQINKKQ